MGRLILFSVLIGGASLGALEFFKLTSSEETIGEYIDIASVVLMTIGAASVDAAAMGLRRPRSSQEVGISHGPLTFARWFFIPRQISAKRLKS
jgi:hypothetical protein